MPISRQTGESLDPLIFIDLMVILEAYLGKDATSKPFLVKGGVKIIL